MGFFFLSHPSPHRSSTILNAGTVCRLVVRCVSVADCVFFVWCLRQCVCLFFFTASQRGSSRLKRTFKFHDKGKFEQLGQRLRAKVSLILCHHGCLYGRSLCSWKLMLGSVTFWVLCSVHLALVFLKVCLANPIRQLHVHFNYIYMCMHKYIYVWAYSIYVWVYIYIVLYILYIYIYSLKMKHHIYIA